MGFKKGQSGNPAGRKKGAVNKTTAQLKELLVSVLGNQMDNWQKDLEKIRREDPAEAMRLTQKLIDYVLPKQTKIDLEGELKHKVEKISIEITKPKEDNGAENK